MSFKKELENKVQSFFDEDWGSVPNGRVLPNIEGLPFDNSGVRINVTVLYADISGSTNMVDTMLDIRAAEYYKAFLHCASKIVTRNKGEIQAYDGDRIMAMFIGDSQADDAVKTAFELHFAVANIVNPIFSQSIFHQTLKFTVGVDSGLVLGIKVGVRAVKDMAWIGSAANYAAKLNSFDGIDHDYPIRITENTYQKLSSKMLLSAGDFPIWDGPYNNLKNRLHYRSSCHISLD